MNVSLKQAIGIHARALKTRAGRKSPMMAHLHAQTLKNRGDLEGFEVWTQVGEQAAVLLAAQTAAELEALERSIIH